MNKLNLGAGEHPLPGYRNIDIRTTGEAIFPLEVPDNTVDEIRASHVLEHFPQAKVPVVLRDWVRALKPGGLLKIAVPDFEWIVDQFRAGVGDDVPLHAYLMGGQSHEYDFHYSVFTEDLLGDMLRAAGCTRISKWQNEDDQLDCASLPVSLNMMGYKGQPQDKPLYIAGAMSLPRYGPIITQYCTQEMSVRMQIPVFHGYGVMWHHSLTRSLEDALAWHATKEGDKADFILTIDYDGVFNPTDVGYLASLLHDNPDVDVVVSTQMKREGGPLLAGASYEVNLHDDLVPIEVGHFGLTMFRRGVFEKLPKPWFRESPDAQGGWDDGRIDSDIGFWKNCAESGIKVCLATRCRVGHLEDVVNWPVLGKDGQFHPSYQKTNEWLATRKPPKGV